MICTYVHNTHYTICTYINRIHILYTLTTSTCLCSLNMLSISCRNNFLLSTNPESTEHNARHSAPFRTTQFSSEVPSQNFDFNNASKYSSIALADACYIVYIMLCYNIHDILYMLNGVKVRISRMHASFTQLHI